MTDTAPSAPVPEQGRQRSLSTGWRAVVALSAVACVAMVVYMVFNLGLYVGYIPIQAVYFYAALTLLCPLVFILFPAHSGAARDRVPWYDALLFVLFFVAGAVCTFQTRTIFDYGWDYLAPDWALWMALGVWFLMLEATRRAAGLAVFAVVAVASFYPWFGSASFLGLFQVPGSTLLETAQYHLFGTESLIGVPMQALVNIVIGFLLFGVALQKTGAGQFFIDLSFAILGGTRGGPAKVAVLSSGLMGSISGSPVTNVVTTGSMTIPAMRKVGFPAVTAGAIEACASTGGVLMPPVMGATAFIMATYLEISYQTIALAAIIPSFLFFLGLFLQIDAMAARKGLVGFPREELPRLGRVLREGWYFLLALVLLVWLLFFLKQESRAPFYATLALIALNQFNPARRWGWADLGEFAVACGRLFVEIATILAGVGLLLGALVLTGKVGSLAYDLIAMAGDNTLVLLLAGALTSMILGMGMTISAAYLFLAIALAPALTESGLNVLAIHMFMLYWGMISYITPPIAFAAFAAAPISGSSSMKTGLEAMRLGTIIYFIPFFFVLNPALIGQGSLPEILSVLGSAIIGVLLLSSALQGYLLGFGRLGGGSLFQWPIRAALFAAGLLMLVPGGENFGGISGNSFLAGAVACILLALVMQMAPRLVRRVQT
ncbi:TRAP transporter permease [Mameliella sediminis]|uniref:TRAP transporter permease n=1 Tax=Mameliella sediminis TaxID=2836866 RepID=UPI001C48A209|nr:TRAP transporter fused permease subunit [Mameliella sediminis]MBY6112826.1 TRAP transporter fused permease subunit [Antarctobacter heliothermus]MBY6143826.1 TRAP transporter fused permease subunit [Mameliella alba]MBV7394094.1 TRAP transporter fused permease subunit [Mameliella sediminis]MBY6162480.1 TRAP transporter fused permease subunit [Mameliella alba]MBY6170954.1 TRAP transporter fused permease subunit [Mameliella alba]